MKAKILLMKRALRAVLLVLLLSVEGMTTLQAQNITFADANAKSLCVSAWDTNHDGELSYAEAAAVTSLGYVFDNANMSTFDELQYFVGLSYIGSYAFSRCSNLTSIVIPNSVSFIDEMAFAFAFCSGSASIEIPGSVTSIGDYVFYNCSSLTSVVLPNSLTSIGEGVFNGCAALTSIVLPNAITTISNYMFCHCSSLTSIEIPNTVTSIGDYAFHNCSGLTTIEIPHSVTSIDHRAFYNCSGLTSMTVFAENPPTLGPYPFYYVNRRIPVYVPEGSIEAYATANWGGFFNFVAIPGGEITVTVNPAEGGTITGGGYYEDGATCTLTVTANTGYTFVSWTENGEKVSTDTLYSFDVAGDRAFVANFVHEQTGNYWAPVEPEQYSNSTIIQGVIQINGVEQYTDQLELGAFCGEECRGSQRASYFPPTGRYIVQLMVFGENNDEISFRLYNHQHQQVLPLTPPANVVINNNGYGSLSVPYELNFTTSIIQTRMLKKGWNWYSTYIEQEGIDGLGQLENSIGIPKSIIQSKGDGNVKSSLSNGSIIWAGDLSSINNEEMYKIGTKEVCYATMGGEAADPSNHPITIKRGWNWIGFPCRYSVSVSDALSGFTPRNGDIVKGIDSYTAYYSDGNYNMWYGALNTFEPGQGYMYGSGSNTPKTLVFQTGNRGNATLANITPENNYYQPVEDYADNMTIIAVVDLNGEELRSDDYELAAFAGDECRGSVKLMYVEPVNRYVAFLTVFGDEADDLHFVLTDGATSDLSAEHMTYAIDGIEGTLDEPVVLRFGTTDVNENASVNVRVYPNPSKGQFTVEGTGMMRITNMLGQVMMAKEIADRETVALPKGMYFVTLNGSTVKVVVE